MINSFYVTVLLTGEEGSLSCLEMDRIVMRGVCSGEEFSDCLLVFPTPHSIPGFKVPKVGDIVTASGFVGEITDEKAVFFVKKIEMVKSGKPDKLQLGKVLLHDISKKRENQIFFEGKVQEVTNNGAFVRVKRPDFVKGGFRNSFTLGVKCDSCGVEKGDYALFAGRPATFGFEGDIFVKAVKR